MVVGPAIGDNALVATPLVERARSHHQLGRLLERARGAYMFQLQVALPRGRVGRHRRASLRPSARGASQWRTTIHRSESGTSSTWRTRPTCALTIAAHESLPPLPRRRRTLVAELVATDPDAFVYLGWAAAKAVNEGFAASGWDGPRVMTTAGIRGHVVPPARDIDGWTYRAMYADDNSPRSRAPPTQGPSRRRAVSGGEGLRRRAPGRGGHRPSTGANSRGAEARARTSEVASCRGGSWRRHLRRSRTRTGIGSRLARSGSRNPTVAVTPRRWCGSTRLASGDLERGSAPRTGAGKGAHRCP